MKTATFTACCFLILLSRGVAQEARRDPPPATPSSSMSGADTSVVPDYRMFPGDKLRVEVYKDQQLSQSLQIRPDGKITEVVITHERLPEAARAGHTGGWTDILESLAKQLG